MPSLIGHSLAGFALDQLFRREDRNWVTSIILANGADLDFLPGLLTNKPAKYHAQASHSFGAAVTAGLFVGSFAVIRGHNGTNQFLRASLLYTSHLVLDFFSKEAPDGQPLLWPFSSKCLAMQHSWFLTIRSRRRSGGFLLGLLTRNNVRAVGREVYSIFPLWLLTWLAARSREVKRGMCAGRSRCQIVH